MKAGRENNPTKLSFIVAVVSLALLPVLTSCSRDTAAAKSMEQIYAEQGIPVEVQPVNAVPFNIRHAFNTVLTGIEETGASAMIGDRVEAVHYRVGDYVKKDAVVVSFPTDNPAAQYFQAKVGYEHALTTYQRMKNLYESGGIALQELDSVRTQMSVAEANWNAVKQSVHVRAPISGILTSIRVRISDQVHSGDDLFVVSRTDRLKAEIWLQETIRDQIEIGAPATATWNGRTLQGKIVQVDRSMDPERQAFGAVAVFDNPGRLMMSGVNAGISVASAGKTESVVIDRRHLIREGGRTFVYVEENGAARKQEVALGASTGLDVPVLKGLGPGDRLIVSGAMQLKDGARVRTAETAAPKRDAASPKIL